MMCVSHAQCVRVKSYVSDGVERKRHRFNLFCVVERGGEGIGPTCFVWWRGEGKALFQLVLCGGVKRRRHCSNLFCVVEGRGEASVQLAMCGGVERRRHRFNLFCVVE